MKIEHIAIWAKDLEKMRTFYLKYFNGKSNEKYINAIRNFSSYFIEFENGARIELMNMPIIPDNYNMETIGINHLAFSTGSKEKVDELTKILKNDGFMIIQEPGTTGDGYYESLISDPEGNRIEITI